MRGSEKIEEAIKAGYKVQPNGIRNERGGVSYTFDVITPAGKRWLYPDKITANKRTKLKGANSNIQEKMKEVYIKIYDKALCVKKDKK